MFPCSFQKANQKKIHLIGCVHTSNKSLNDCSYRDTDNYLNAGGDVRDVSFYRDASKREVDLVIRRGRTLHPVEVKSAASVPASACRHFSALDSIEGYKRGFGAVICQADAPYLLAEDIRTIPAWTI